MPNTDRPEAFIKPGQLYQAYDRVMCANLGCAGIKAKFTGITIDGHQCTPIDADDVRASPGQTIVCDCGAQQAHVDAAGAVIVTPTPDGA